MKSRELQKALEDLKGEDSAKLLQGIRQIGALREQITEEERYEVLSSLVAFFYIDTHDHPELQGVVEEAARCIASFGPNSVPFLLSQIAATDVKAQLALAATIGRIGKGAYEPLMDFFTNQKSDTVRAFALYALGKIKDPCVAGAIPEVVRTLNEQDKELRDTAARTLGKILEVIDPASVEPGLRGRMFDAIFDCIGDGYSGVRAKAVRTMGKLARYGFLTDEQKGRAKLALRRLAGVDDRYHWDRAYIVRREAEIWLPYVS
jgi:HEAT repeat protein